MSCQGCAKCGDCCDAIILTVPWSEIQRMAERGPGDARFIVKNWSPITKEEAERRVPGATIEPPKNVEGASNLAYYECQQFDRENRLCRVHGAQPRVCSEFPWYGQDPVATPLLPFRRCSFWHEIPQEQWPDGLEPLPMVREC